MPMHGYGWLCIGGILSRVRGVGAMCVSMAGSSLACPQDGKTPISRAAYQGHMEVVRELMDGKANVDTPDKVSDKYSGRRRVCADRCKC